MHFKTTLSLLLVISIGIPVAAQKQQVDWEAKMLTTELSRLGDPEINLFLPELYKALAESRSETEGPESGPAKEPTKFRAPRQTMMSLLDNPSVRRELKMLDDQYEEIRARSRRIQDRARDYVYSELINSDDGPVSRQSVRTRLQTIREDASREIENAILPFQFERLRQIAFHVQMRQQGVVNVLINDPLATDLGITEEQKESLVEQAKEIDQELAEEIAKLRAKAKEKLFSHLKPEQQKKLETMIGEEFTYEPVVGRKQRGGRKPTEK